MSSSEDNEPDLADFIDRHNPEKSQDSDLPAWIQAHVRRSGSLGGWFGETPPDTSPRCVCAVVSGPLPCLSLYAPRTANTDTRQGPYSYQ